MGGTSKRPGSYGADQLLRLLLLVVFASALMVAAAASVGLRHIQKSQSLSLAQDEAVWLCDSLVKSETARLFHPDGAGGYRLRLDEDDIQSLTQSVHTFLRPLDILKVKIYDAKGALVFSTEPSVLGHTDAADPVLKQALSGLAVSRVHEAADSRDLGGGGYSDRDLIEAYVPIHSPDGLIAGSFEIYRDMNRYSSITQNILSKTMLFLLALLTAVFCCSFLILRCGFRQLGQAQSELHHMATRDNLTGLFNRRELLERARSELARVVRAPKGKKSPLSFILLDLDHFKFINDTYGHPAGDCVLKAVARRITDCIRDFDSVGRYGGEEFLLVLPGADHQGAHRTAERIRQAVAEQSVTYGDRRLHVTASLGISTLNSPQETLEILLKRADMGLYLAKHQGRDRVGCVERQDELSRPALATASG